MPPLTLAATLAATACGPPPSTVAPGDPPSNLASGGVSAKAEITVTAAALTSGAAPSEATTPASSPVSSFTTFESGQVRPLALSANRRFLYATNTPDGRIEIFRVRHQGLQPIASVPVGLEPVALAERCDGELWVVNHLSDSVSIVDVRQPERAHVVRTLLVGDEPRDIVFAGPAAGRAFITTAHRGQNTGRDPQLTTPGVGRADVWVFDADHLGTSLAGSPLEVITLFADTPRALAVSPDGNTVYAAAFHSGNRTTAVMERLITRNGFLPPPFTNAAGVAAPPTGLVVKYRTDPSDGEPHWLDNVGRRWDAEVKLSLPDQDVFAIDAAANPPTPKVTPGGGPAFTGVGTVLFNLAVNPVSGKVYVSNLDSHNDVRFEGHNGFGPTTGAPAGSVRGHIADSRITVIDPTAPGADAVHPRLLNKHLDYSRDGTPDEAEKSLAFPTGMAVSADGRTVFVAALGSGKVGVFSTRALESDTFVPSRASQIGLSAGGPSGLVLNDQDGALYVLTRFDNGISVVDTRARREVGHLAMFNPEPPSVTVGRRFLYDAASTSSHGDSACASCHIFGDFDSLAWDLGDPDDFVTPIPGPFTVDPALVAQLTGNQPVIDHPMKGPMTTQSLRGMANHGPMHWRGDRTGGTDATRLTIVPSAQPDTGTFDEQAAFKKFNVAFAGLLGRSGPLSDAEMQAFTDFILQVSYPPNPIRQLDDSLTPAEAAGRAIFFDQTPDGQEIPSDTFHNCNGCHVLDPAGNAAFGVDKPGFFGSDGRYSFEAETQFFKVPHLRNLYQKVGMFGMANTFDPNDKSGLASFLPAPYNDTSFLGDQVRGFGFFHDGSVDTVFRFHGGTVFSRRAPTPGGLPNPGGFPVITDPGNPEQALAELQANLQQRRQVEAFMLAFDSNLAPIVGQQATLGPASEADVDARIALLEARAGAGECDLVASGWIHQRRVGFLFHPATGTFVPDRRRGRWLASDELRALGRAGTLTFTAVPPGSGRRIALDRDLDGRLDGDDPERGPTELAGLGPKD
jgi:DNA-binding beta-propeller fold protein YncE